MLSLASPSNKSALEKLVRVKIEQAAVEALKAKETTAKRPAARQADYATIKKTAVKMRKKKKEESYHY
jgi:hypothetical protein